MPQRRETKLITHDGPISVFGSGLGVCLAVSWVFIFFYGEICSESVRVETIVEKRLVLTMMNGLGGCLIFFSSGM